MIRVRRTSTLLLGILIGAIVPALYLLDMLVHINTPESVWLEAEFDVHRDGQDPGRLALWLVSEGDWFVGEGSMHQSAFPWEPMERGGRLRLRLRPGIIEAGAPGEYPTGWAASYEERQNETSRWTPPLPCEGVIVVSEIQTAADGPAPMVRFEASLDLRCTSAGPDLLWGTGDEHTWTLEGPLTLRSGRLT